MTTSNKILQNYGTLLKANWQDFVLKTHISQIRFPSERNDGIFTEFKRQRIKSRFIDNIDFELPDDPRVKTRFVYIEETKRSDESLDPFNFEVYDKESLHIHINSQCKIHHKVTHMGKRKDTNRMMITQQTIHSAANVLMAKTTQQIEIENAKKGYRFVILNLEEIFGFKTIKRTVYTRRFETRMVYFIEGLADETDATALISVECDMETMSITNIETNGPIENMNETRGFIELANKIFALDPAIEMKEIESLCFLMQTRKQQKPKQ